MDLPASPKGKGKAVVGGPSQILLEGIRRVLLQTCDVPTCTCNPDAWVKAVSCEGVELAVFDAGHKTWDVGTLLHRLPAQCRGIGVIALLPAKSLHKQSSRLLPTSRRLELLSETVPAETLLRTARRLLDEIHHSPSLPAAAQLASLTEQQRRILLLLCQAESTRRIAEILRISVRTVEFHKYRMMKLLGVNTTTELVLLGVQAGLGPPAERTLSAGQRPQ